MFSEGRERVHWEQMGWRLYYRIHLTEKTSNDVQARVYGLYLAETNMFKIKINNARII